MKFFTALSFLVAAVSANPFAPKSTNNAKAAYMGKLMRGATPTANSQIRKLDEEEYVPNIAAYSVKFEQCQFVKSYDAEMAEEEDSSSVLATKRFVVFRLCPDGACSSCNYDYGEYLVDLETYLSATVEYMQSYQEGMCEACDECSNGYNADGEDQQQDENNGEEDGQDNGEDNGEDNGDDNGENRKRRRSLRKLQQYSADCSSCYEECQKIENMEDNGFYDATNFLECGMIYDPDDDSKQAYYAGPICASGGTKIKIGVFTDENCLYLDSSKTVDDYLKNDDGNQMYLSHALLKTTYSDTCISCMEPSDDNDNNDGNDAEDEDNVIEMCETLYQASAKCEKSHGFDQGYSNYYGYENQLANEGVVCDFVQSLKSGTYDEQGEIVVTGASASANGGASTSGGQKLALTFFILGTVGLAMYSAMLHSKLTKGGKADLSSSGGAMA